MFKVFFSLTYSFSFDEINSQSVLRYFSEDEKNLVKMKKHIFKKNVFYGNCMLQSYENVF